MIKTSSLLLATAQLNITANIRQNGRNIRKLMKEAKPARLVHFPEGALSGYTKQEIKSWQQFDWKVLEEELHSIAQYAGTLGIWVVLGCAHRLTGQALPHNSLYIISDTGRLHTRYDKQFCSNSELKDWYTPGTTPCTFLVDSIRFACVLCIEINFPKLFANYNQSGVDCILFSAYANRKIFGIQAQGYAASYNSWVSISVPVAMSEGLPSQLIGPSGFVIEECQKKTETLICHSLNVNDPKWDGPLRKARPWRKLAREGNIYQTASRANDPRSVNKTNF